MQMRGTIAVVVGLGLVACAKPVPQVVPALPELPQVAAATVEPEVPAEVAVVDPVAEEPVVAVALAPASAFDEAAYEKALLAYASCTLNANGQVDVFCPAAQTILEASFDAAAVKVMEQSSAAIGRRLINHSAPSVRVKAAEALMNVVTLSEADVELMTVAAKGETNAAVLTAFITALTWHGATNPKVGELLLWAADHADEEVRFGAIRALSEPVNRDLKGGVDKLIAIIDGGSQGLVRDAACRSAGNLGDAKLMPIYRKILTDKSEPDAEAACFNGLTAMWWSYPQHLSANEEAYRLTLEILAKKPRTEESPSWMAYGAFQLKDDANFASWKTKAPWYDESAFKAVLADIILDPKVKWLGRVGAVESLATIATKADLEAIEAKFPEKVSFEEGGVLRSLRDAIFAAE